MTALTQLLNFDIVTKRTKAGVCDYIYTYMYVYTPRNGNLQWLWDPNELAEEKK